MKRVFLIVLDSFGIGHAPDADKFGDVGANTLKSAHGSGHLDVKTMISLGLSSIEGVDFLEKVHPAKASYGRMVEVSAGKDTTVGHWEIAGLYSDTAHPTYPGGFPDEIIREFEKRCKRRVICNKPYSGTEVIRDFGKEHLESGALIVYTSADSVFQIAAHEECVPLEELYRYCEIAREMLVPPHAVGRVIARPFIGEVGNFVRTANRHDFSLLPPRDTLLDAIKRSGKSVIGVGKIGDIFAGKGLTESIPTGSNADGMARADELVCRDFSGLAFINLVDFDSKYGHRQDARGYALALSEFDAWLADFMTKLSDEDALIITADHGCDPADDSTDHTREYVPLLIYSKTLRSKNIGTVRGFGTVANTVCNLLDVEFSAEVGEIINLG